MRALWPLVAIPLIWMAVHVPWAFAQIPHQDSVAGSASLSLGVGEGPCTLQIDVRSGPSGESPEGGTLCTPLPGSPGSRVTCLDVDGNVALMTVVRRDSGSVGSFRITDNGPGAPDVVEGNFGPGCPEPQPFYFDLGLISGDFVVVDAPPLPSTKEECKNGVWMSFGVFKNQGDCVSFAVTGGRSAPALP